MKTRILHTKFWTDSFILNLTTKEKCLFLYFITNERINICGVYELPDKIIMTETGLTSEELQNAKQKFEESGRMFFHNSWICVKNVEKYNTYSGPSNEKARKKEISLIPEEFIDHIKNIDPSVDTSVYTAHNTNTNQNTNQNTNKKSEIRNQNQNQNQKKDDLIKKFEERQKVLDGK